MKGTDKQILWAEEIRGKFMPQAEKILNSGRGQELLAYIREIDSAKWWIENRHLAKTVRGLLDFVARQIFLPTPGSTAAMLDSLAKQGYRSGDITLTTLLNSGNSVKIISQTDDKIIIITERMGTMEFSKI